jgi:uncharacterized protein
MPHDLQISSMLAALCGSADPAAMPVIFFALLGVGFVGSLAHCGPMCGPFVLAQTGAQTGDSPGLRRLASGILPFYQLGRLTAYAVLGAAAGGFSASFVALTGFRTALSALLALAALAFLLQGLKGVARFLPLRAPAGWGNAMGNALARVASPLLRNPSRGWRGVLLGLLLGLLPCGFLYAALMAAAATGSALAGALAMIGFGLGTAPALIAIGILGQGFARRWRPIAARLMPAIFLVNALSLGTIALRLTG